MSQLLRNISSIIGAFEKYAQKDGDCSSLSKAELKQLIQREFADVIVNPNDPQTIESVLQLLDTDGDGKVDFEEFTVLVFRVARACHKKTQACQAPSEGQSKQGEGPQQEKRDEQTPGEDSTCRPTQEPQAPRDVSGRHPTVQSQKPSQEPKQEPLESGGQTSQTPKQEQDPTRQSPQEPSVTGPGQSKIQDQRAKQDQTGVAQRLQQDPAQESHTVRDSSPKCTQKHKTSDQGPTQDLQISEQGTSQQPARPHQGRGQGRICQGEVEPPKPEQQQPGCKPGQQEEQCPSQREIQRLQRGQQEPRGSRVTDQSPSCRQVQQPQNPEQGHGQAEQKPQVGVPEQALNDQQRESLTQREHLTQQEACQPQGSNQTPKRLPEHQVPQPTTSGHQECGGSLPSEQQPHQQERRPQNQEQIPTRRPEGQSHQQERRPQNPVQAPSCRPEQERQVPQQPPSGRQECGSGTTEEQLRQEDRRPQKPVQAPSCRPEQEQSQVPQQPPSGRQECGSGTTEEQLRQEDRRPQKPVQAPSCRPEQEQSQVPQQPPSGRQECAPSTGERCHQRQQDPQKPEETQFHYYECEPVSPEQGTSTQEQSASQARESDPSCDPAEVAQDPKDSSTRKPVKATWPASHQKPLQFPSPWSSKQ